MLLRCRSMWSIAAAIVMLHGGAFHALSAQDIALSRRAFVLTFPSEAIPKDLALPAPLREHVTLHLEHVKLETALRKIAATHGLRLWYSKATVPVNRIVSADVQEESVAEALRQVLQGTNLELWVSNTGQMALVPSAKTADVQAVGVVKGKVTDAKSGQPVRDARVTLEGTSHRAVTQDDGSYVLSDVSAGNYTLTIRALGFSPFSRAVTVTDGGVTTSDAALIVSPTQLSAIVTTATGTQRRLEVANSIALVNADSITRTAPVTDLSDLISGRAAGVQWLPSSGVTGSGSRIRIRGLNSISLNNDPIIYIDGVRAEGRRFTRATNLAGSSDFGAQGPSRLDDLNPDEIQSLEIVRGPSAVTLYGTDAANGVIIITTKHGKAGPPRWNLTAEVGGVTMPADFPSSYYSWGHTPAGANVQCTIPDQTIGTCVRDSLTTLNLLNDPSTTFFSTGPRSKYGMQLSGGSEVAQYFLSGELENERGSLQMSDAEQQRLAALRGSGIPDEQIHPNGLRRASARSNLSMTLGSKADGALSLAYVSSHLRVPPTEGNGLLSLYANGLGGKGYVDALGGWKQYRGGDLLSVMESQDINRVTGGLTGNWRPVGWLATRARGGLDYIGQYDDLLQQRGQGPALGGYDAGRSNAGRSEATNYTADLGLTATFALGPSFSSRTSVGGQYYRTINSSVAAYGLGLTPGTTTVNGGTIRDAVETTDRSATLGQYLEQTFGFRDRMFVTGGLRSDKNSAFGINQKTILYPRGSFSWLLSGEPFVPKIPGVSTLRYRLAYGASGVSPGPRDALLYYQALPAVELGRDVPGLRFQAVGNPNLKPERTAELETGLDIGLFGTRANLELTYYNKLSHDALISRPLAPSLGTSARSRFENLGSVRNRGFEYTLTAQIIESRPVTWDATLTGSTNQNRVMTLGAGVVPISDAFAHTRVLAGYPIYGYWERPILGFSDVNGDGLIGVNEVQVGDTAVYFGASTPTREISLNTGVTLFDNRLRFAAQFDHRGGFKRWDGTETDRCQTVANCRGLNDPSASLADQAAAVAARSTALGRTAAGYIVDASFTKLREVSATYYLPASIARAFHGRDVSITVAGRNLATWTDYPGLDPETNTALTSDQQPMDYYITPLQRYWLVRINAGF